MKMDKNIVHVLPSPVGDRNVNVYRAKDVKGGNGIKFYR